MADLTHIKKIEPIPKYCGPVFMGNYTLLYNEERISMEDAIRVMRADEFSPYVLVIPKLQMDGLFRNLPKTT